MLFKSFCNYALIGMLLLSAGCGKPEQAAVQPLPQEELIPFPEEKVLALHPLKLREKGTPRITAVCYHEVLEDAKDIYAVSPQSFRRHLREFKLSGYSFIGLKDLKEYRDAGRPLPPKPLFISFDDGYLNNYTQAYPILREEGAKATFFVVSGNMEHKNRMTFAQMREMAAHGMEFGSHTLQHEKLTGMSDKELEQEIVTSKELLEAKLRLPVYGIAYPCGYASPAAMRLVQQHYRLGFYANVDDKRSESYYTFNRYGVFRWNEHIRSIFQQPQPKLE